MKIFNSLSEFYPKSKTIVTIGTFDGVHIGHRKILERIVHTAQELNCESTVLTFFPHPRMVLQNQSDIKLLNTLDEKIFLLEKTDLQNLIIHSFDESFYKLSAEEFVKTVLVHQMNVQKIIIGHDHRFGSNRTANIDDLIVFGEKYGFEVEQISAQEIDEVSVSSTKIRNALTEGNIRLANEYLGYNYFFSGKVVKGKQLGRTIGFPTANIEVDEKYKLLPQNGVYIVDSIIDSKPYYGMMNIGNRPTVDGKNQTIEVHFLDFEKDIYDQNITVNSIERIRAEQKFDSFDLLKMQIEKDKEFSISYIKNNTI